MSAEFLRDCQPSPLEAVWEALRNDGYAVVSDEQLCAAGLGFGSDFREHVERVWFGGGKLYSDPYNVPPHDRERFRGVLRYLSRGNEVLTAPHHTADIATRSYTAETIRHYPNDAFSMLADPVLGRWVCDAITLVPPELRCSRSTFGVNGFRTHTSVVERPHSDDEAWVLVYVLDKTGVGAESALFHRGESSPFFTHTLEPGELLIFNDDARNNFLHSASALESGPDGVPPYRDTLVCTWNKPETYPLV